MGATVMMWAFLPDGYFPYHQHFSPFAAARPRLVVYHPINADYQDLPRPLGVHFGFRT
jgi:hypothetical protein